MKVTVEYLQLPYSCSSCQAFGHSLARCSDNPDKEQLESKRKKSIQNRGKYANQKSIGEVDDNVNENDNIEKNRGTNNAGDDYIEDFMQNKEKVPYNVGRLFGCEVVMDEDQILADSMARNLPDGDDLDTHNA
ncbi:hypothetical protein AgCh_027965 [Apium graveolens]